MTSSEVLAHQAVSLDDEVPPSAVAGWTATGTRCTSPMNTRFDVDDGGSACAAAMDFEWLALFSGRPTLSPWSASFGFALGGSAVVKQLPFRGQLHS